MILYIAWLLIYSSVFISIFYLGIYSEIKDRREEHKTEFEDPPSITVLMPAYNEEKVVEEALESAKNLDYPNYKVNFVDDASTDSTLEKARNYASDKINIYSHEKNRGKAAALNTALENTDTDYIVVQDADSKIKSDLIYKALTSMEEDSKLGAVIASIKPLNASNFIKKLQMVEYQLTNFFRLLMTEMNTLNVTPGAFSIYRTEDVKEAGGFDEGNITEDLEMAFKLRKEGKLFEMIYFNASETDFPSTLKGLYNQRVRWARGFMYNAFKYREMFFNKDYGYFGTFQLPMLIIMPALIVLSFIMVFTGIITSLFNFLITGLAAGFELPAFSFDKLYFGFLSANLKVYIPLILSLVLIAYIIKTAYQYSGERPENIPALLFYFFGYFLLQSVFWIAALLKELTRSKKIWT
jgi:cellulose synthase/poly-beta-1,6-N-acetylglucosamine synthase-like glycosyltransferase